jgi:hypothetical protein
MLTDPNQSPVNSVNGPATPGFTGQIAPNSAPGPQPDWRATLNPRRLSRKKLQHLAILWSLLVLLCLPVAFLAPGWLYIVAAAGIYRLAYLAGLEIKCSPGKLLRKLLILLMVIALALWFIRSETNKPVGREGIPVSPIPAGKTVRVEPPTPVNFHP